MKLRVNLAFVSLVVSIFVLVPSIMLAQDVEPPKCCNAPTGTLSTASGTQGQIMMSDTALRSMGLSRSRFVDYLIAGLLPGRQVTIVFSVARPITRDYWQLEDIATGEQPAQLILQYRIPKERMRAEEIDALDQLAITDGEVHIQIYFKREPALAESLP
jgi:hypothetical protein